MKLRIRKNLFVSLLLLVGGIAALPFVFAEPKSAALPAAPRAPAVSVAPVGERDISEYS